MPNYDYLCDECGHRFEAFQSISAEPLKSCPLCGGKVERLISSGAGLIFKGSGFYITDYKKTRHRCRLIPVITTDDLPHCREKSGAI